MIKIDRSIHNPIITPRDVKPSREDFRVDGVFNAGATTYKGKTILLLRIAESVINSDDDVVSVPYIMKTDEGYKLAIKTYNKRTEASQYDFEDTRGVLEKGVHKNRLVNLTSLSHLRLASSQDGVNFEIEEQAFIFPEGQYETWGIEDPRITNINDVYYINYTAVSELGAVTALARTTDFITYERMGVIFPPENKDVALFPEKIGGLYYAYHRPVPKIIGDPNIWVASSKDLVSWGNHTHLMSVSEDDGWESGRIGGGAPSFKTDKGWIHIYHAADKDKRYCLGVFMTALDNPRKIISKSKEPIMVPLADYEKKGYFGNVVFTCGVIVDGGDVKIYYGASDEVIGLASIKLSEIYRALGL